MDRPRRTTSTTDGRGGAVRAMLLACIPLALACGGGAATAPEPGPVVPPAQVTLPPGPYVPGQSYFGANGYVEYIAGDLPVILTAPHGGTLAPASLPLRACGTNARDTNTEEQVREMAAAFRARTGRWPHVVINRLHRNRLDANRDSTEATCGDTPALTPWREWHAFIGVARQAVLRTEGRGWYMDMHGHGHEVQRLELGYLIGATTLDRSDAALDASVAVEDASSIRTMSAQAAGVSFSALLRGATSLGTLYANEGFPSTPSLAAASPASAPYFDGGYNTARYGCRDGGMVCGVQIESNFTGVRDGAAIRARFAEATVRVLTTYLGTHWGIRIGTTR